MTTNRTFSALIARLPVDTIDDHYPQPFELGEARDTSSYYFGAIRAMLLDEEVAADVELRHATAMTIPFKMVGDEASIAFAEEVLSYIDIETLMEQILQATEFGFMPIEPFWQQQGQWVVPVRAEVKRPEDFQLTKSGQIYYTNGRSMQKSLVPVGKVIPVLRNASSSKPYGESILEPIWPIWQTKWINYANMERLGEKYAIPSVVALAEAQNGTDLNVISNSLAPLLNGDSVALSGVTSIEVLDAKGKVEEILKTVEYIDNKISKTLTGQTLTSGNQQYGSRSLGEVHERAAFRISRKDAKMVCHALNHTLLRWVFQFNQRDGQVRMVIDEEKYQALISSSSSTTSATTTELSDAGAALCL